ncbi:MAG: endonuclease IV [Lentisphaerae bacterium ADurb.Bin242]|nr:MAG: endonuclease IV [Lentisphaerae bacterium ADurb.Bin242]
MKEKKLVHFVEWKKLTGPEEEQVIRDLPRWGVTEIVAHPVWGVRNRTDKEYLAKIRRMLGEAGLHTPACHAFWGDPYDLAFPDEPVRKQSMAQHCDFIKELAEMGVKTYTVHLGNGPEIEKELAWSRIRKSVDDLLPAAEEAKMVLALENGHDSFAELERLTRLVEGYGSPSVGMCYDTGHAHCYTPEGWKAVLELMRPHIATCHMHDNFGSFDDHNPPGGGTLCWPELVRELKACPKMLHAETESGDWSRASWEKFRTAWEAR